MNTFLLTKYFGVVGTYVKKVIIFSPFVMTLLMLSSSAYAANHSPNTYIPVNADKYLPLLKHQQEELWPELNIPYYLGALVEKESCYTLTSKRCWDPTSRLKTDREEGAGLFQLTKAYKSNGALRFDTLTDLSRKYSKYLRDLSWSTVYQRPDLQLDAGILLSKENWTMLYNIKGPMNRMYFTDASYNQGVGNTYKQMRLCGLTKGCNPQYWFDNVSKMCTNNKILYGTRSACDINRDHVYDIFKVRLNKYKDVWSSITPTPFKPN